MTRHYRIGQSVPHSRFTSEIDIPARQQARQLPIRCYLAPGKEKR